MTRRKAAPDGGAAPAAHAPDAPASDAPASTTPATDASPEGAAPAEAKQGRGRERRPKRTPKRGSKPRTGAVDRVHVADDALATVVGLAAHEVPGVVGMAPASLSEGLRRILGVSQVDEGVEVAREDDGATARIVLHVVVAYGVNIPAVAESVVERVRYAAKTYAGVKVEDVKVRVAGVSRG